MPLITLDNLSLSFSEKPILNEVSATILKSDKIALIGRNGEGKSTFMAFANITRLRQPPDKVDKIASGLKVKRCKMVSILCRYCQASNWSIFRCRSIYE
jgi:ATP-binding cassette subfamily F protein uup